jgi:hypothetical protein
MTNTEDLARELYFALVRLKFSHEMTKPLGSKDSAAEECAANAIKLYEQATTVNLESEK